MGAPMKLGGQNGYRLSNPEGFCVAAGAIYGAEPMGIGCKDTPSLAVHLNVVALALA